MGGVCNVAEGDSPVFHPRWTPNPARTKDLATVHRTVASPH
jgi:hypothetical protein